MLRKNKLYLDTSVPSAYFDVKNSFRQEITKQFWKKLENYHVFISDLTIKEINAIQDDKLKQGLLKLIEDFACLSIENNEVKLLAEEYILRGIIPVKHFADAIHIAVATVNSINILTSWNYEHIVKLKTKREINALNSLLGYNLLEIIDPAML